MLRCSRGTQSHYGLGHPMTTVLFFHNRSKKAILGRVSPKKTAFFCQILQNKGAYRYLFSHILENT